MLAHPVGRQYLVELVGQEGLDHCGEERRILAGEKPVQLVAGKLGVTCELLCMLHLRPLGGKEVELRKLLVVAQKGAKEVVRLPSEQV